MPGEDTDLLLANDETAQRQSSYGASVSDENSNNEADEQRSSAAGQRDGRGSDEEMTFFTMTAILSTAFSYGCIMTTLFLITLPVECERVNLQHKNIPKR